MAAERSVMYEPKNPKDLTHFLESNKEKYREIWIVLQKKSYADPQPVSFTEAVGLAIKQGLIDSRTKTLNEERYAIRFTKRRNEKIGAV